MTKAIERRLVNGVWETVVVDENGGSGNLPDPSGEPDGDVLTVSSGAAVWSPGGGSQTVKCVDLGVVDASDVAAGATVTLYTPGVGEIVRGVFLDLSVFCDASAIAIGSAFVYLGTDAVPSRAPLAVFDSDLVWDSEQVSAQNDCAVPFTSGPVILGGTYQAASPPAAAWQANHGYALGDVIFANGTYWFTADTGNSGGSPPDFAGNAGGSVVDNAITWTDSLGQPPTVGTAQAYALVLTPA